MARISRCLDSRRLSREGRTYRMKHNGVIFIEDPEKDVFYRDYLDSEIRYSYCTEEVLNNRINKVFNSALRGSRGWCASLPVMMMMTLNLKQLIG